MKIEFTKMQGLGNDFVVIDTINQAVTLNKEQVRFLADRHFGVGCDQVLMVAKAADNEVDFEYRIFNSDGGEVGQCGNGARCFARFVRDKGLTDKREITVRTKAGVMQLCEQADGQVSVNMGIPVFAPARIPFVADDTALEYEVSVDTEKVHLGVVSMGNPHAVLRVDDVASAPVQILGSQLESHARFPQRVNVGFMQVIDKQSINLRVFERGVGETQACGSGACAAVVVGRNWRLLDERVNVNLPGGSLLIQWAGDDQPVWMTGPAQTVFEGRISI
ncbi:diaminopimelate epimerase [Kaarinaea lacus]